MWNSLHSGGDINYVPILDYSKGKVVKVDQLHSNSLLDHQPGWSHFFSESPTIVALYIIGFLYYSYNWPYDNCFFPFGSSGNQVNWHASEFFKVLDVVTCLLWELIQTRD